MACSCLLGFVPPISEPSPPASPGRGRFSSPDHAPRGPFFHVRAAHARRRPVRPDRCAATRSATRLGVICLFRRPTPAHAPPPPPPGCRRDAPTGYTTPPPP